MSVVRGISRAAVGGYIKAVRFPLDAAVRVRARNGGPGTSRAEIALDRMEALARGAAARMLGDEQLREDAARRRIAADERARALRLHGTAHERAAEADERYDRERRVAQRKRSQAERRAQTQRRKATAERELATREAERASAQRRATSEAVAERTEGAIDKRAKRERLDRLDQEAQALAKRERALTAQDEAQRLGQAAGRAKAARKNSSDE